MKEATRDVDTVLSPNAIGPCELYELSNKLAGELFGEVTHLSWASMPEPYKAFYTRLAFQIFRIYQQSKEQPA